MATIGNLVVNLTGNANPLQAAFQRASGLMQSFTSRITSQLGGITGILSEAVGDDRALNKLNAVLSATGGAAGLTADEITTLASDLQKVTNYADDTTISAAAVLATFKEIKGDVFRDALKAAQDMSAVMGQDLQASVVQIGKALNDPAQGFSALQRVGVAFTQQQQDMIKTLVKSGDTLGAQKIILKELQSEFGGAAQKMADPLTQLRNVMGDLAGEVGKVFVPVLSKMKDVVVPFFKEWGVAIGYVVAGMIALTVATKAAAAFQMVLLAMRGPAGIAALAAGVAAATTAALAVRKLISELGNEQEQATETAKAFSRVMSDETPAMTIEKTANATKHLSSAMQEAVDKALKLRGVSDTDMKLGKLFGEGMSGKPLAELEKAMRSNDRAEALKSYNDAMRDLLARISDVQNGTVELGSKMREFGATGFIDQDMLNRFNELNNKLNDLNAAKALEESLLTPLEKAQNELRKIEDLRSKGMLTDEAYRRAVEKTNASIQKSAGEPRHAGAAVAGSREAYSIIAKNMGKNGDDEMKKIAEKQLEEAKKQTAALEKSSGAAGAGVVIYGGDIPQ